MGKKIYAFVTCKRTGFRYAAHIEDWSKNTRPEFSDVTVISKSEYRQARNDGMPSWGEHLARFAPKR